MRKKVTEVTAPITHPDKSQISSVLNREQYDRLEQICKRTKMTKSEFIRRVVLERIDEISNRT